MPEIILSCPQCERTLRVPEELIDRLVKCPACGLTFSVPAGGSDPRPVTPFPVTAGREPERQPSSPNEYDSTEPFEGPASREPFSSARPLSQEGRQRYNALITPPAICLLITGILGLLASCFNGVHALIAEPQAPGPDVPEFFRKAMEMATPQMVLIVSSVFAGINLLIVLGAVQMLRRRMYWLAITSSLLAMLNFECLCCLLGIPSGIWSLVVLSKPEVRALFR